MDEMVSEREREVQVGKIKQDEANKKKKKRYHLPSHNLLSHDLPSHLLPSHHHSEFHHFKKHQTNQTKPDLKFEIFKASKHKNDVIFNNKDEPLAFG